MNRKQFIEALIKRGAWYTVLEWIDTTPGTPEELWEKCDNENWKRWLLRHASRTNWRFANHHERCLCCLDIADAVPWALVEAFLAADYDGGAM